MKDANVLTVSDTIDQDGDVRSRQVTVRIMNTKVAAVSTLSHSFLSSSLLASALRSIITFIP